MNFFLFFVFGFLSKHRKVTQTRHTKPHHIAGLEYIVCKIIVINIVSGPQNHNDDCCSCHFVTQQTQDCESSNNVHTVTGPRSDS